MELRGESTHDASPRKYWLAARLELLIRVLGARLAAEQTRGGPSPVEWLALTWLEKHPGMPLKSLAASLHMNVSGASRMLQDLVERGFVEWQRLPDNRRSYSIHLTPLGRDLQARAKPLTHGSMRRAIHGLSDEDLTAVIRVLGECLESEGEGR